MLPEQIQATADMNEEHRPSRAAVSWASLLSLFAPRTWLVSLEVARSIILILVFTLPHERGMNLVGSRLLKARMLGGTLEATPVGEHFLAAARRHDAVFLDKEDAARAEEGIRILFFACFSVHAEIETGDHRLAVLGRRTREKLGDIFFPVGSRRRLLLFVGVVFRFRHDSSDIVVRLVFLLLVIMVLSRSRRHGRASQEASGAGN